MNIEFEGMKIILSDKTAMDDQLKPGDIYCAKRNQGWKFLTCKEVVMSKDYLDIPSYILNEEGEYPYDAYECRKVLEIKELE